MTSAMDLPLHGKIKLHETSKSQLLDLWNEVLRKHSIPIRENSKVDSIVPENGHFLVKTANGEDYSAQHVLLAIGRRGTPRKLNIPGENQEKVAYRLLEPEEIKDMDIMVVGGGDSAIESALMLAPENRVVLSYRDEAFKRIKPGNSERINQAIATGLVDVRFNTNLTAIDKYEVTLVATADGKETTVKNDLVYIFAGGELPTEFLQKAGIQITRKFGEAVLKHK
jgi:thioredoxin reductase